MKYHSFLAAALFAVTTLSAVRAADIAGKWTSEFDSQIGPQKYVYIFKMDGGKLSGTAAYDHSMGKGENALTDIKLDKDDISFVEPVHINDMDLRISYAGKVSGDEMKLTRTVGDFAVEEIVVKRAKDGKTAASETKK